MTVIDTNNTLLSSRLLAAVLIIVGIITILHGIQLYRELINWESSAANLDFIVQPVFEPHPPILIGFGLFLLGFYLFKPSGVLLTSVLLYCAAIAIADLAEHQIRYLYFQGYFNLGFAVVESTLMYVGLLSIAVYISQPNADWIDILRQSRLSLLLVTALLTALQFIPYLFLYRQ